MNINAIYKDLAALDLYNPAQWKAYSALSRPSPANDAEFLLWCNFEREVSQYDLSIGTISEENILEFNVPALGPSRWKDLLIVTGALLGLLRNFKNLEASINIHHPLFDFRIALDGPQDILLEKEDIGEKHYWVDSPTSAWIIFPIEEAEYTWECHYSQRYKVYAQWEPGIDAIGPLACQDVLVELGIQAQDEISFPSKSADRWGPDECLSEIAEQRTLGETL